MILGVGVDLVSIERISKIYAKYPERFLRRIFTACEREAFRKRGSSMASLAARYAAKEAVLKAIGCGIGPAALCEVEVVTTPGKQPLVNLSGDAARQAKERKITAVALSITHEPPIACAVAAVYAMPVVLK
ncbi:MAG TPA: holo-ACP synthase [Candidatus Limnocylindrales bacterium]|nr:holo-ACP synthase [Candidatus Limnocylindrales bacterium]